MKPTRSITILCGMAVALAACDSTSPTGAGSDALTPAAVPALNLSTSTNFASHTAVIGLAEEITDPASGEPGRVIWYQKDLANGQLSHDFVYGDPRRASFNGGEAGVTFAVNKGFPSLDANLGDQNGWLYDSINIWDAQTCSDLTLSENSVPAAQPGFVHALFTGGELVDPAADLTQVGFLTGSPVFSSPNVLGVTWTLFWQDENGNLTDIDRNGKIDVAFREIYYNDAHEWADNGLSGTQANGIRYFDLPAVAIHEVGHGFSAAHFGNIGVKDGYLFPQPRAIMNAIYSGVQRELTGRDEGLHCSNWAQWPNS